MAETPVSEINNLNLSYLLLAQRLVKEDSAVAMLRLGLSRELADLLDKLTFLQVTTLASSGLLLFRFRFDDPAILSALTDENKKLSLRLADSEIFRPISAWLLSQSHAH